MLRRDQRTSRPAPVVQFWPLILIMLVASGCVPAIPPVPPVPDAPDGFHEASSHGACSGEACSENPSLLRSALGTNIDTMDGAVAMDLAAESSRSRVLPKPDYQCSPEATASGRAAEQHMAAGLRRQARAEFAAALQLCPGNARWWIDAGDAELLEGNLEAARRLLERGLSIDPWNREGHRYLAYAETGLGNDDESWRHSVLAVISDPTCETCWASLRQATAGRGGTFHRQYERKPVARAVYGRLDLELDPFKEISGSRGWVAYAIGLGTRELRFADLWMRPASEKPTTPLRKERIDVEWAQWSPLERERYLVRTTLEKYQPDSDRNSSGRAPKTWPVIKNAVEQGYLDEAIFMQLLDAALVPEFVAYRRANDERLFDHVTSFLAVLPSGVGKRRSSQTASVAMPQSVVTR